LPGVPGGFCGGEGGFASGFGAGRMGAGPVMTSKSKLLRCMEIFPLCWTKGRSKFSGFRCSTQET
jgi:hypothetical protein